MSAEDDSYYRCLCGVHVHRGAFIIAIVGIVFETLAIISNLVQNEILFAISALIGLGCYACVLYANKYERPAFYLPHIVINAISIILSIIFYFIGLIAAAIFISKEKKEGQVSKDEVKGLAAGAIVVTAILLILYLIQLYFVRVVYRARHYMINVLHQSTSGVPHFTQTPVAAAVHNIL